MTTNRTVTFTAQVRVDQKWVAVTVKAVSAYDACKKVQTQYPAAKVKWPTRSAW